ncbi:MAG: hypothetical protein ACU83N_09970 [Gammaproteobacteria bacterium]
MIRKWFRKFWGIHGNRLFFGGMALGFAFYFLGSPVAELKGAGLTIMIGLAMECYRQARGGTAEPEDSNTPTIPKE